MIESFGTRLQERIRALGPLCVGIDPSPALLQRWERPDSVEGLEFLSLAVLEAVGHVAVALKPQVAFFERFGSAGYRVLERLLDEAREADVLVVADAKRGDIGSTNEGYAEAWLAERSPLRADAVTMSPYLGVDSLAGAWDLAAGHGRGVFVLAATSNEEGRVVQSARTEDGERIEDLVVRRVAEYNRRGEGLGSVGVVIGATRRRPDFDLATLGGPYLVPGVGTQGATVEDVGRLFERCPSGTVLVNVARAVLVAGPARADLRDAAQRWRDDLTSVLP